MHPFDESPAPCDPPPGGQGATGRGAAPPGPLLDAGDWIALCRRCASAPAAPPGGPEPGAPGGSVIAFKARRRS